jgi:hypothetical protein
VLPSDTLQLFCQVTGIADTPERRGARRRSVHPSVQGWPGPSATGRSACHASQARSSCGVDEAGIPCGRRRPGTPGPARPAAGGAPPAGRAAPRRCPRPGPAGPGRARPSAAMRSMTAATRARSTATTSRSGQSADGRRLTAGG